MHERQPRRRAWPALTDEEKQARLQELRQRQQSQIDFDLRLLRRR